ncbi:hypothetical protein llap_10009 [Limosa lapponica baueri]|uniref:Uncharacterized protein n=1 Tax=Limosa lapponica baueri TaxID=1758121 RepID=A0A2I0U0V7_LIMLA|nr:hypothetical protein llap_10009 [Limosa lapponica baueri]
MASKPGAGSWGWAPGEGSSGQFGCDISMEMTAAPACTVLNRDPLSGKCLKDGADGKLNGSHHHLLQEKDERGLAGLTWDQGAAERESFRVNIRSEPEGTCVLSWKDSAIGWKPKA